MPITSPKKLKASDRQAIARKVMTLLKKRYGGSLPRDNRPLLETLLFAVCLENTVYEDAASAFDELLESFHDLNEIRVSSISEIEVVLSDLDDADWRALRIREVLQFTFENYYSFNLDQLKRKTADVAEKRLQQIRYLTPFVRAFTLQNSLGTHVVPIDDVTRHALIWLGLVPVDANNESASDEMKSALRKNDAPLFCHLLRQLVTDRKFAGTFGVGKEEEPDPLTAVDRLQQHLKRPKKPVSKSRKKPAASRSTTKSKRTKKTGGRVSKKVSKPKKTKRKVASR